MSRLAQARAVLAGRKVTTEARPRPPLARRVREAARVLAGGRRAVSRLNTDARLHNFQEDVDNGLGYANGGHRFFRRITQNPKDLPDLEFRDMVRIAVHLTRTNPYARRIIELRTNYVLGDGVSVICEDEDVQTVVDEFLGDPVNKFDRRLHGLVSSWRTLGELILPLIQNPVSGLVRVGYISPDRVAQVVPWEHNAGDAKTVRMMDARDAGGQFVKGPEYQVVHLVEDPESEDDGLRSGEVLYIAANRLPDMTRGLSDLYPIADYLEALEQTVWNLTESSAIRNAFVLHVVYSGLDDDEIAEKHDRANAEPPAPGEVIATNDGVEYKFLTPTFAAGDASGWVDVLISAIATGADLPPWALGKGDDPTKANAAEFTGPMLRSLKELQRETEAWIADLIDFQIDAAIRVGRLGKDVERSFQVVTPELESKDASRDAAAAGQGIQALVLAKGEGLIDTTSAQDATAELVSRIGPDVDGPTIRDRLEVEAEEMAAELDAMDHAPAGPGDPYAGRPGVPDPNAGAQATTCPHCGADAAPNLPCPDCHAQVPGNAPPAAPANPGAPPPAQEGRLDDLVAQVAALRESMGRAEVADAWPAWPGAATLVEQNGIWTTPQPIDEDGEDSGVLFTPDPTWIDGEADPEEPDAAPVDRDALVDAVTETVLAALGGEDALGDLDQGDAREIAQGAFQAPQARPQPNRKARRAMESQRRKAERRRRRRKG